MGDSQHSVRIPPTPAILDHVCLRNFQLPLPCAPEPWHRPSQRQPCTMSIKLSCSSIAASAADDDVSLSLDYGKLFRRIEGHVREWPKVEQGSNASLQLVGHDGEPFSDKDDGEDLSRLGGMMGSRALEFFRENALEINSKKAGAIQEDFGQCDLNLHFPNILLRAEHGLSYRNISSLGQNKEDSAVAVVVGEEFRINNIRCHCIIGINPPERLEKQAVVVSLEFKGPGHGAWSARFLETYQEMTRVVAEVREAALVSKSLET